MAEILFLLVALVVFGFFLLTANLAQRARERGQPGDGLAIFTYLLLGAFQGALALGGVLMLAVNLAGGLSLPVPADDGAVTTLPSDMGPLDIMPMESPQLFALSLLIPGLLGILVLLPPVRRALARILPIDAGSAVHAVALSLSMLVPLSMGLTLGIGLGNLIGTATAVSVWATWAQALFFVLLAMVGVGWPVRRSPRATLERLGIVVPSGRQVLIGVGLAVVMVFFVMFASAAAASLGFGVDAEVEELTEELLGGLTQSLFGIVTLGAAAALGEEALMRGAAQPRLGLVYTSLLFALLHSNYGISFSTAIVFVLGMVLGWVRMRHNTTTAMILHASYNGMLGLLAYFSIELMGQ